MVKTLINILLLALCLIGLTVASCKRSTPAPKPEQAADTLVICVGGWGKDRTITMADAIRARCARAYVVSAGSPNGYRVDIRPFFTAYPKPHKVLILHSFASWYVAVPLPPVDYVVLLDPVSPGGAPGISFWGDEIPAPAYAASVDWFRRADTIGPPRANVAGLSPITVPGGHDDVPINPDVISEVVNRINAL